MTALNVPDLRMKNYLQQYINSKINQTPEPAGVLPDLINAYRDLAEFQSSVKETFLEYQTIQQQNPEQLNFIRSVLINLEELRKDGQRKFAYYIFKEICINMAFESLNPNLKALTQKALEFIDKKIDYFCSYTRKGLPTINSSYKEIIYDTLFIKPETHPEEWKNINLVAKLLVKHLNDHGFNNYFFDLDKMKNGEEIQDVVLDYCDRATVLLLLAQQETFRDSPNEINWCYREYDHYNKTHTNQKYFLVFKTENLARPANAGQSILKWFNQMADVKGIYGNTIESGESSNKLKSSIDNVAYRIEEINGEIFDELIFSIQ